MCNGSAVEWRSIASSRVCSRAGRSAVLALKGGYAIEFRIETARTTKDIDLSIAAGEAITPQSLHRMVEMRRQSIWLTVSFSRSVNVFWTWMPHPRAAAAFPFRPTWPAHGSYRDRRRPHRAEGSGRRRGWFDFAGLPRPQFRMISREQQFAEKLHAYKRPRRPG
jgi:hypothetical protein